MIEYRCNAIYLLRAIIVTSGSWVGLSHLRNGWHRKVAAKACATCLQKGDRLC